MFAPAATKEWRDRIWSEFERVARERAREVKDSSNPREVIEMLRNAASNQLRVSPHDVRMQKLLHSLSSVGSGTGNSAYSLSPDKTPTRRKNPSEPFGARPSDRRSEAKRPTRPVRNVAFHDDLSPGSVSITEEFNLLMDLIPGEAFTDHLADPPPIVTKRTTLREASLSPPSRTSQAVESDRALLRWRREAEKAQKEVAKLRAALKWSEGKDAEKQFSQSSNVDLQRVVKSMHEKAEKCDILNILVQEVEEAVQSGKLKDKETKTFEFLAKEVSMFWKPAQKKSKQVYVESVYGWMLEKGIRRGARVDMKLGLGTSSVGTPRKKSVLDNFSYFEDSLDAIFENMSGDSPVTREGARESMRLYRARTQLAGGLSHWNKVVLDFSCALRENKLTIPQWFEKADTNSDGLLTYNEFVNGWKMLKLDCHPEQISEIFKAIDSSRTGHLSLTRLSDGVCKRVQTAQQELKLSEMVAKVTEICDAWGDVVGVPSIPFDDFKSLVAPPNEQAANVGSFAGDSGVRSLRRMEWAKKIFVTIRDASNSKRLNLPARFHAAAGIAGAKMTYYEFGLFLSEFQPALTSSEIMELCHLVDSQRQSCISLEDLQWHLAGLEAPGGLTRSKIDVNDIACLRKFQRTVIFTFPNCRSLFCNFSRNGTTLTRDEFCALLQFVDESITRQAMNTLWNMSGKNEDNELSMVSFRLMVQEDHILIFRNPDVYTAAIWPWIDRIPLYKETSDYISRCVKEQVERKNAMKCGPIFRQDLACSALPLTTMRMEANDIKVKFDIICQGISDATDGTFHAASIKKPERAQIKSMIKYGGDKSHLCDLVRGTICYPNIDSLYQALRHIVTCKELQLESAFIISFEDRVQHPMLGGYRDCQLMFRIDDHTCELQLHLQDVFEAKSQLQGGHFVYEVTRKRNEGILLAAMLNVTDAARRLIDAKGCVNAVRDKNKLSAVHFAALYGEMDMLKLLVENGGSATVADEFGLLPVYRAVMRSHWEAAQFLLRCMVTESRKWSSSLMHQCVRLERGNVGNGIRSLIFFLAEFCPTDQLDLLTVFIDFLAACRKRTKDANASSPKSAWGGVGTTPPAQSMCPLSLDMFLHFDPGGRTLLHMLAGRQEAPGTALRTFVDACRSKHVPIAARALSIDYHGRSAWRIAQTRGRGRRGSQNSRRNFDFDGQGDTQDMRGELDNVENEQWEVDILQTTLRDLIEAEMARRDLSFAHYLVEREMKRLSEGSLSQDGVRRIVEVMSKAADWLSPAKCASKEQLRDVRRDLESTVEKVKKSAVLCRRLKMFGKPEAGSMKEDDGAGENVGWSRERLVACGFSQHEADFILTEIFEEKHTVKEQWRCIKRDAAVVSPDGMNQLRAAFLKKVDSDVSLLCQLVSLNHGDTSGHLTKDAFFQLAPNAVEEDWLSLPKHTDGRVNLHLVEQTTNSISRVEKAIASREGSIMGQHLAKFINTLSLLLDTHTECVDVLRVLDPRHERLVYPVDIAELFNTTSFNMSDVCKLWETCGFRDFAPTTYDQFKVAFIDPVFAPLLPLKRNEVTQSFLNIGIRSSRHFVEFFTKASDQSNDMISYDCFFHVIADAISGNVHRRGSVALDVLALWPPCVSLGDSINIETLLDNVWSVNDANATVHVNTKGIEFTRKGTRRKTVSPAMEHAAWCIQKHIRDRMLRRRESSRKQERFETMNEDDEVPVPADESPSRRLEAQGALTKDALPKRENAKALFSDSTNGTVSSAGSQWIVDRLTAQEDASPKGKRVEFFGKTQVSANGSTLALDLKADLRTTVPAFSALVPSHLNVESPRSFELHHDYGVLPQSADRCCASPRESYNGTPLSPAANFRSSLPVATYGTATAGATSPITHEAQSLPITPGRESTRSLAPPIPTSLSTTFSHFSRNDLGILDGTVEAPMSDIEMQLLGAFQRYDEVDCGLLDLREFCDALESVGMPMSLEECHELCEEMKLYAEDGTSVVYSQYLATLE